VLDNEHSHGVTMERRKEMAIVENLPESQPQLAYWVSATEALDLSDMEPLINPGQIEIGIRAIVKSLYGEGPPGVG
jgi:hypothetical protein